MSKKTVADIGLNTDKPTKFTFADLYTWIIWQFPRLKNGRFYAAVHPPIEDHGWFPALINSKKKRLNVYAHLDKVFHTPEAAADFLKNEG